MRFSVSDLASAVVALSDHADRDLLELEEQDLVQLQMLAATVKNLAEVPLAVVSHAIATRPSRLGRSQGHQSNTHMSAQHSGSGLGRAKESEEAGGLFGSEGEGPDDAGAGSGADDAGAGSGAGEGSAGGDDARAGQTPPPRYPLVAEAFRTGRISTEQAALLRRTLDQLGELTAEAEPALLDKALTLSIWNLRRACRAMLAKRNPESAAEREKRHYQARSVKVSEDSEGMVTIVAQLDAASAAPVRAWLDAQVRDAFQRRRRQEPAMADRRMRWQIMADAFVMLFSHGLDCEQPTSGVKTQVVVRMSEQALRRDLELGDCDQTGEPMTAGTLRRMAADAGIIPVVLGGRSEVLDLGRRRRLFSRAQRIALLERDGGCAFCHAPAAWCAAHHITPWSRGGLTDLKDGVMLCTSCHTRIHDDGWSVRVLGEHVWFTPPESVDPSRRPRLGGRAALEIPVAA